MHAPALALLLLTQLPPSTGPTPMAIKGLRQPQPLTSLASLVRFSMKDLSGGAVVVVEDTLPMPLPTVPAGLSILGGRLHLLGNHLQPGAAVPTMPWMDTGAVRSGPNVVQRSYPLGWGY